VSFLEADGCQSPHVKEKKKKTEELMMLGLSRGLMEGCSTYAYVAGKQI
jgi:hypothetical protein